MPLAIGLSASSTCHAPSNSERVYPLGEPPTNRRRDCSQCIKSTAPRQHAAATYRHLTNPLSVSRHGVKKSSWILLPKNPRPGSRCGGGQRSGRRLEL